MKKIRIGIIGCGHLGKYHAQIHSAMADAQLVGVHDEDRVGARALAGKHNCKAFALDELLCRVDAVSVATPASTHFEIVSQCLEKGCHVLVEKPIAQQAAQAKILKEKSEKHGKCLCVGHVERFNPAFQRLLQEKPAPRFMEIHRLAAFGKRGLDVDVVLDLMVHDIDLVFQVAKAPLSSVEASGVTVATQALDIVNARLVFEDGCTANLTSSRISNRKMRKFRVFQQGSYFSLDLSEPSIEIYRLDPKAGASPEVMRFQEGRLDVGYQQPELPETNALEDEITAFLATIREGRAQDGIATADDGLRALEVAETVIKRCGGS